MIDAFLSGGSFETAAVVFEIYDCLFAILELYSLSASTVEVPAVCVGVQRGGGLIK